MKFNLDKTILDGVITKLGKVLSNSTIPILNGVLIQATEEFIVFTGSNGMESIIIREPVNRENGVEVIETGAAVLPREIFNVTKKLKGVIEFATNDDCTQIHIQQKRTNIDFSIMSAEEYPSIIESKPPLNSFKIPAKEFEEIVRTTSFAASDSDARPVLRGLHFTIDKKGCYKVVATNSHRLAQTCSPTPITEEDVNSFTVPANALEQAIKSFELKGDVAIATYPNKIALVNANAIVYSSLLEGNYPQTDRLIPSGDSHLILVREELIDALDILSAIKDKERGISSALMIVQQNSITLESKTGTSRTQQEIQILSNQGVELDFKMVFDVKYALDALKALNTQHVKMEINGSNRPFIFHNVFESDASKEMQTLQLILPMRLV